MNIEELHYYCSLKQGSTDSFPFDNRTLAYKVYGKIFAIIDTENYTFVNLKCEPEYALDLRERYEAIQPGFHMSHKHWNTIQFHTDVDDTLLKELIDHSYQLVYKGLSKKVRDENPLR